MKFNKIRLVGLLIIIVLPMRIVPVPADTSETNFYISGHTGSYAHISRGCEGEVLHREQLSLKEISGGFDKTIAPPARIGLRGSYIVTENPSLYYVQEYDYGSGSEYEEQTPSNWTKERDFFAVNPFMDLEWNKFGIGAGFLYASKALPGTEENYNKSEVVPSFYARFGSYKKVYVDASLFHSTPLISGGYFKLGLGSKANPNFNWWFGLGAGEMYDAAGFLLKTDFILHPSTSLNFMARLGGSEGVSENSVGIGVTYHIKSGNN